MKVHLPGHHSVGWQDHFPPVHFTHNGDTGLMEGPTPPGSGVYDCVGNPGSLSFGGGHAESSGGVPHETGVVVPVVGCVSSGSAGHGSFHGSSHGPFHHPCSIVYPNTPISQAVIFPNLSYANTCRYRLQSCVKVLIGTCR